MNGIKEGGDIKGPRWLVMVAHAFVDGEPLLLTKKKKGAG